MALDLRPSCAIGIPGRTAPQHTLALASFEDLSWADEVWENDEVSTSENDDIVEEPRLDFILRLGDECSAQLESKVTSGIDAGIAPITCESGSAGGVYFFRDARRRLTAVFKPADEEPSSQCVDDRESPRGMKPGIQLGEGFRNEMVAYLLDQRYGGLWDTPSTALVRAQHIELGGRRAGGRDSRGFLSDSDSGDGRGGSGVGSLQQYVRHDCSAEEVGWGGGVLPTGEVHKVAVMDLRLFNSDRHRGNLLVNTTAAAASVPSSASSSAAATAAAEAHRPWLGAARQPQQQPPAYPAAAPAFSLSSAAPAASHAAPALAVSCDVSRTRPLLSPPAAAFRSSPRPTAATRNPRATALCLAGAAARAHTLEVARATAARLPLMQNRNEAGTVALPATAAPVRPEILLRAPSPQPEDSSASSGGEGSSDCSPASTSSPTPVISPPSPAAAVKRAALKSHGVLPFAPAAAPVTATDAAAHTAAADTAAVAARRSVLRSLSEDLTAWMQRHPRDVAAAVAPPAPTRHGRSQRHHHGASTAQSTATQQQQREPQARGVLLLPASGAGACSSADDGDGDGDGTGCVLLPATPPRRSPTFMLSPRGPRTSAAAAAAASLAQLLATATPPPPPQALVCGKRVAASAGSPALAPSPGGPPPPLASREPPLWHHPSSSFQPQLQPRVGASPPMMFPPAPAAPAPVGVRSSGLAQQFPPPPPPPLPPSPYYAAGAGEHELCQSMPDLHQLSRSASVTLVPIDHGFCLPDIDHLSQATFCWAEWAQCRLPFSAAHRAYIAALDTEADIRYLRHLHRLAVCATAAAANTAQDSSGGNSGSSGDSSGPLALASPLGHHRRHRAEEDGPPLPPSAVSVLPREGCLQTLRLCTHVLQTCAAAGWTPYDIAQLYLRQPAATAAAAAAASVPADLRRRGYYSDEEEEEEEGEPSVLEAWVERARSDTNQNWCADASAASSCCGAIAAARCTNGGEECCDAAASVADGHDSSSAGFAPGCGCGCGCAACDPFMRRLLQLVDSHVRLPRSPPPPGSSSSAHHHRRGCQ